MQLNKEQIEAVNARDGAWCVMATAGAGKSTVICERVRALFKEGVVPDDLLVVTFTKEAASSLEKRLGLKIPKDQKGGFRTFHSFCLNLVRREAKFLPYGLSSEPFPDGPVLSKILLGAMKENGIKRKQFDEVKAFISRWKRQRILPREVEQHDDQADNAFILAYEKYEQRLRDGGMLDFDGMVVEAVNILEQCSEVRDRWSFLWVMADEFQDTDTLQVKLLQLVSKKHGNIFCVGDSCQSIYEFRGACPTNTSEFCQFFPNAVTLILPENFRSSPQITAFSKQNAPLDNDLTKNIRTSNPNGPPIEFRMYPDAQTEAKNTIEEILRMDGGCQLSLI